MKSKSVSVKSGDVGRARRHQHRIQGCWHEADRCRMNPPAAGVVQPPMVTPHTARRPWVDHWLDVVQDLSVLRDTHPMMDAVIDEIDGRMIRVGEQLARGLRLVQLPRLRPRPRDHRGGPGLPRRVGHASELVAAARQPGPLRADRGAADRAARLRGLARAADDHAHPHVGDPAAGRLGHDLPRRARAQDDLRRLPGRARARRRGPALPLRGPRPPRRAAARRARPDAARLHGRREQHDRQRARPAGVRRGRARSTARCCTSTTRTASA